MHPPYSICKAHLVLFSLLVVHAVKKQAMCFSTKHAVMIESHLILFRDHKSHMTFPLEKIRAFSVVD